MVPSALATAAERLLLHARFERSHETEILDGDLELTSELAANFRDIERVNRYFGGSTAILRQLEPLVHQVPASTTLSILDLGTGVGDIPIAIANWAKAHNRAITITASDYAPAILQLASQKTESEPTISLRQLDARAVDLPDRSYDVTLCSLTLHHFSSEEAVQVLHEMHRLSRIGFIVNDLRRSHLGYYAAWIASRTTTRNRLTRHDAPISVRRAFTPEELRQLLKEAGICGARVTRTPWFRMTAVKDSNNGTI
jgi:ubiquinone/menaquinone biosynthesis C-methylase UbiE